MEKKKQKNYQKKKKSFSWNKLLKIFYNENKVLDNDTIAKMFIKKYKDKLQR